MAGPHSPYGIHPVVLGGLVPLIITRSAGKPGPALPADRLQVWPVRFHGLSCEVTMYRCCQFLMLLIVGANLGHAYVSWDGYLFAITDGTARLKKDGEIIFICDRREVQVVDNHLLVANYHGQDIDIVITDATAVAIGNEFRRDTESRLQGGDGHGGCDPHRPPVRPLPPPVLPPLPADQVPPSRSLPAQRSM
jgi:hypothetical protein